MYGSRSDPAPAHHPRIDIAPADAARDRGRVRQPEIAALDQPQPVAAVEDAHMLVGMTAAAVDPKPGGAGQALDDVIALDRPQLLRAADVRGLGRAGAGGQGAGRVPPPPAPAEAAGRRTLNLIPRSASCAWAGAMQTARSSRPARSRAINP